MKDKSLIDLARKHRKDPTEAEGLMWELLRNYFYGFRFRRQHVIAGYIVDFACTSKKLIIEVDGEYHFRDEQQKEDKIRTENLNKFGYTVLRFTNDEVMCNTDSVLDKIKKYLISNG